MRGERAACAVLGIALLLVAACGSGGAAVILDWADWQPTFDAGSTKRQSFVNADGVRIDYQPSELNANGKPKPEFVFGTPAIGAGGAGASSLLIQQTAEPGDASRHRLSIKGGTSSAGVSINIGDIDGSTVSGNNFIDELQFNALLADGSTVSPTRVYVTNAVLIGADTVAAIPNSGLTGSVEVFFDVADVERVEIVLRNSTSGTVPDGADTLGISIGNFIETGLTTPPVPEPASGILVSVGLLLALQRRR